MFVRLREYAKQCCQATNLNCTNCYVSRQIAKSPETLLPMGHQGMSVNLSCEDKLRPQAVSSISRPELYKFDAEIERYFQNFG